MKFKVDENLPVEISQILQEAGYKSSTVLDQKMGGKIDQKVIDLCRQEDRALVTLDLDFSDIRHYPPSQYNGIIVLKALDQSKKNVMKLTNQFIPLLKTEPLKGQLWIVEMHRIRIREETAKS